MSAEIVSLHKRRIAHRRANCARGIVKSIDAVLALHRAEQLCIELGKELNKARRELARAKRRSA